MKIDILAVRVTRGFSSHKHQKCWDALRRHVGVMDIEDCTDLVMARSYGATRALEQFGDKMDVVLWVDDDMVFDPAVTIRLCELAHQKQGIVGIPYSGRGPGSAMIGQFAHGGEKVFGEGGQLYEAFAIGGGMTAVSMNVYRRMAAQLEKPWHTIGVEKVRCWPFYSSYFGADLERDYCYFNEDYGFCRRAVDVAQASLWLWTEPRVFHLSGFGNYPFGIEDCQYPVPRLKTMKVKLSDAVPGMVSCLCVTKGETWRVSNALDQFDAQTHNNKELVLVHQGLEEKALALAAGREDVKLVKAGNELKLGALRNLALKEARGQYFAQWDDDDQHDPRRLDTMLEALKTSQSDAVILDRWRMRDDQNGNTYVSHRRGWEGTIVGYREHPVVMKGYPVDKAKGEDEDFVRRLAQTKGYKLSTIDKPELYTYIFHGENTWEREHFDGLLKQAELLPTEEEKPQAAE